MSNEVKYTVGQLIEALKTFPPDMPIITSGYEDEYENVVLPKKIVVQHQPNQPYYTGQYHACDATDAGSFEAVVIEREVRALIF